MDGAGIQYTLSHMLWSTMIKKSYGNCYEISLGVLECVFPVFDSFPALFFFCSPFSSLIITNYFLQRKKERVRN